MLFSSFLPQLMPAFAMSKATGGSLTTLMLVATGIGSLLFGLLSDRYGRKRLLIYSILTFSIFTFLCGLAPNTIRRPCRGRWLAWHLFSWPAPCMLRFVVAEKRPRACHLEITSPLLLPQPAEMKILWRAALPRLLALLSMNTFGLFGWWGLFSWMPAYLTLPVAQGGRDFRTLGTVAFVVVINLAGMVPGYLFFLGVADRIGHKKTVILYLFSAAGLLGFCCSAASRHSLTRAFSPFPERWAANYFRLEIRALALGVSYNATRSISALAPLLIGRRAKIADSPGRFLLAAWPMASPGPAPCSSPNPGVLNCIDVQQVLSPGGRTSLKPTPQNCHPIRSSRSAFHRACPDFQE
jgi:MFS family permease